MRTKLDVKKRSITELDLKVIRWSPWLLERTETHLEYTLFYVSQGGRIRWVNAVIDFAAFKTPEAVIAEVLRFQTAFVQAQWTRLEVLIPNRDAYGNLAPGYVKDTGVLAVERAYKEAIEYN